MACIHFQLLISRRKPDARACDRLMRMIRWPTVAPVMRRHGWRSFDFTLSRRRESAARGRYFPHIDAYAKCRHHRIVIDVTRICYIDVIVRDGESYFTAESRRGGEKISLLKVFNIERPMSKHARRAVIAKSAIISLRARHFRKRWRHAGCRGHHCHLLNYELINRYLLFTPPAHRR